MPATAELVKYNNLPTANSNTACKGPISVLVYVVRFMNIWICILAFGLDCKYILFWFQTGCNGSKIYRISFNPVIWLDLNQGWFQLLLVNCFQILNSTIFGALILMVSSKPETQLTTR